MPALSVCGLINAATGVSAVDIYATAPGANLDAAAPSIAGVTLGSSSGFVTLPAGNVEIRITPANTKEVIYDSTPQSFSEHAQFEAVVYTRASSKLVGVTLLNVGNTGTSITSPNLLAQFKVINGSSVPSPLNVFVNQNLLLSNIPFGGASSYQKTASGAPTVSVEATATPGATLLTLMPTLGPGTDSSILLVGYRGRTDGTGLGRQQSAAGAESRPGAIRQRDPRRFGARCLCQFQQAYLGPRDEFRVDGPGIQRRSRRGNDLRVRLQCRGDSSTKPHAARSRSFGGEDLYHLRRRSSGGAFRHRHRRQLSTLEASVIRRA